MLRNSFQKSLSQRIDKVVLFTMNHRLPASFEHTYRHTLSFEEVLAQTRVDLRKTAEFNLSAPGEHPIWLHTPQGEILCRAKVRLALDPHAPLILYHHGFNEIPYYNSWQRIFAGIAPLPAHTVCIQAPFHEHWRYPFEKGMVSLQSLYQLFAGSLRSMELVQNHFEQQGAAFTVLAGYSWGGITSLIYEGLFHRTRAVIPMLSSPNVAQVMWDIAQLFQRSMVLSYDELHNLLDFTPYYQQCHSHLVFPLLGEHDLFFRLENHANIFAERPIVTIPQGHITGAWMGQYLRQHVFGVLERVKREGYFID